VSSGPNRSADEHRELNGAVKSAPPSQERGDVGDAEQAYRRADKRRDANGAFKLGLLLAARGDLAGAAAAYHRASDASTTKSRTCSVRSAPATPVDASVASLLVATRADSAIQAFETMIANPITSLGLNGRIRAGGRW
jgi:predicted TPR repeat methyltransferase